MIDKNNNNNKQYASISSLTFWKSYWTTMRPYLAFLSGAAGLVGLAFIRDTEPFRLIIAFIPLFISYGLGQSLTDCFQMDTDAISSPYRPLVRGIISKKQVLSVSLIALAILISIMFYLNPMILAFGVMVVFGLLAYTKLKRTWWGGPPWNSWVVAMLPIMGRLVDREYRLTAIIAMSDSHSIGFVLAVLAIFFGYANFVVMGYFKDISADSKTGYNTFPVAFGWGATALYSDITALAVAFLVGASLLILGNFNIFGVAIYIMAVIINLLAQLKIHRIRDESQTFGPIANVVRAFILYCIAIIVTLKPNWIIFMTIYYLLFEMTLKLRPEKTQV